MLKKNGKSSSIVKNTEIIRTSSKVYHPGDGLKAMQMPHPGSSNDFVSEELDEMEEMDDILLNDENQKLSRRRFPANSSLNNDSY